MSQKILLVALLFQEFLGIFSSGGFCHYEDLSQVEAEIKCVQSGGRFVEHAANIEKSDSISRPNILLLYADDLGIGDLSSFNSNSKIPTKNLDELAKSGRIFTDAHSSAGTCSPSRYSMLTGRYHWRRFNDVVTSFGGPVISSERLTLPRMLKETGYHTALIGKWHLGWDWSKIRKKKRSVSPEDFDWEKRIPKGPTEQGGFDYYFGEDVINFPPYCWFENDQVYGKAPNITFNSAEYEKLNQKEGRIQHNPGPMVDGWVFQDIMPTLVSRGVSYIQEQRSPWFLMFSFPTPHLPIIPHDDFDGSSNAGPYGDAVVELDDAVGQLLKAVEEKGETKNTLVIFTSDNGPESLAYDRSLKFGHWSSAPMRGLKRDLYEGGHRVPLIVKWPGGNIPSNTVSNALISQIDFFATLSDIVGFTLPDDAAEDSYNQIDELRGEAKQDTRQSIVYNTVSDEFAIRHRNFVFIDSKTGYTTKTPPKDWNEAFGYTEDKNKKGQLFDLDSDLEQRKNILGDKDSKDKAEWLSTLLNRIIKAPESPRFLPVCDSVLHQCNS